MYNESFLTKFEQIILPIKAICSIVLVNIQDDDEDEEVNNDENDSNYDEDGNEQFEIDEEEAQIAEAFRAFDHNNDGYLDITDLRRVLLKLGHSLDDEVLQEVLDEADSNGDGKIDYYGLLVINYKLLKFSENQ